MLLRFRATIYPCPDSPQERREMSIGVMTRIEDLKTVLGQTQDHRHRVLVFVYSLNRINNILGCRCTKCSDLVNKSSED